MNAACATLWPDARDNRDTPVERSMCDARGDAMRVNRCDDPVVRVLAGHGKAI